MQINITPSDVDQLVKDAILKSSIGDAIEKALKSMFSRYDCPVQEALKAVVKEKMKEVLNGEYMPQIELAIHAYIKEKVDQKMIDKITSSTIEKMMRQSDY